MNSLLRLVLSLATVVAIVSAGVAPARAADPPSPKGTNVVSTAPPEAGNGQCWPAGKVCWDDDGDNSCRLNCCSKLYHQDPKTRKDVCDPPKACWNAGTKCWDDMGSKSCKLNCCSGTWHEDSKLGYDVCDAPAMKRAVVGYGGPIDDELRQTLKIGQASCWEAGRKCWNNSGRDSCWDNCCSKAYYHDDRQNADVCAPIPADNKCYAQYTPCWDSLPTPKGKYYVEVSNGKKVYYPSCFQCCARISRNGSTHWPAWTEYYIGTGTHDANSARTHWSDALVAGLQGLNPVQDMIDHLISKNQDRAKRGGRPESKEFKDQLAQEHKNYDADRSAKEGAKVAIGTASKAFSRAGGPVGVLFDFFFGFFSKLTEPQWDLCD